MIKLMFLVLGVTTLPSLVIALGVLSWHTTSLRHDRLQFKSQAAAISALALLREYPNRYPINELLVWYKLELTVNGCHLYGAVKPSEILGKGVCASNVDSIYIQSFTLINGERHYSTVPYLHLSN